MLDYIRRVADTNQVLPDRDHRGRSCGSYFKVMKTKSLLILLSTLAAGCISLPENASEHRQCDVFRHRLVSDVRVAPILAHKPNRDVYVEGDNRVLIISVNTPEVVTLVSPGHDIVGPGNQYTSTELAVIENAALDIRAELGIERQIVVYDDSTKREHKAQRLESPPPTNPPADGKR